MIDQRLMRKFPAFAVFLLTFFILFPSIARAQLKEEILEKKTKQADQAALERDVIDAKKEGVARRLNSNVGLEASYETNPRLLANGKPDKSGRVNYGAFYKRPLTKGVTLNLNYDVDGTVYTDFNELSNILNHGRLSVDKSFNKSISIGVGYDLSFFYYPKEKDSDYTFHKGFVYLKHNITKKMYHQVTLEEGYKQYLHAKPYLSSTTTYRDERRQDYRHALDYTVGLAVSKKATMRVRAKYAVNDANALYQDYHDYKSLDITPSLSYKITDKLGLNLSFNFSDKDYKERLVANTNYTRRDKTYSPNVGLRYNLTKAQVITLGYGYTENATNEPTGEYKSTTINCGWQYGF